MKIKELTIVFACLVVSLQATAQQEPRFTLFNQNYQIINPAAIGSRDNLSVSMLYRYQWVGYEGAPRTGTITTSVQVLPIRSAIGVSFMNDQVGIVRSNAVSINYAFIAQIDSKKRIAFGTSLGMNENRIQYSNLETDPNNAFLAANNRLNFGQDMTHYSPQIGLGVYYYTDKFKFGISTPSINNYKYYNVNNGGTKQTHLYAMLGSNFIISEKIFYNLRLLGKFSEGTPMQGDIMNQFIMNKKYALGCSFRTGESVSVFATYIFHEQFNMSYAYDIVSLNKLRSYQYGSHEIALNYLLPVLFNKEHVKRKRQNKAVECADPDNKDRKKLHQEILKIYYDLD